MKRNVLLLLAALVVAAAPVRGQAPSSGEPPADLESWVEHYDRRYGLDDLSDKRTDNHGNGFEELYGTRNFRVILKGVAYRGGANNAYHRSSPRDNRNPLSIEGLENLCEEGFGRSYYLYSTNFDTSPTQVSCESPRHSEQTLQYFQVSSTDVDDSSEVLRAIYETIKDYRHGPIYIHCWNGWHASGLLAAKILRQFCGLSAEEAVAYWDRNTDGNNQSRHYESVRQRIRDFTPYAELEITEAEADLICP